MTGLDRGDALGLTWSSVDTRAGVIVAPRGKTSVPRQIPIMDGLADLLEDLRKLCPVGAPEVFRDKHGLPLNLEAAKSSMRRARAKAGITKPGPWKVLRHTFGSRLAMAGVDQQAIQQFMGHTSPLTTARYMHLSPTYLRDQMSKGLAYSEADSGATHDMPPETPDLEAAKSA